MTDDKPYCEHDTQYPQRFNRIEGRAAAEVGKALAAEVAHLDNATAVAFLCERYEREHGKLSARRAALLRELAAVDRDLGPITLAYRYADKVVNDRGPTFPPNAARLQRERAERERAERERAERERAERERAERLRAERERAARERNRATSAPFAPTSAADKVIGVNMAEVNRRIWAALARTGVITSAAAEWAGISGLDPANDDHQRQAKAHR